MKAIEKNRALQTNAERALHVLISLDDADTLRRAALTLQRWSELRCGVDGYNGATVYVEQDEQTGVWHRYVSTYSGVHKTRTADRQTGALKRVQAICTKHNLHYYHQTDPRGAPIYLSATPIDHQSYDYGFYIYAPQ